MKSHILFVYFSPPSFFFPLSKSILLPLLCINLHGSPWLQTLSYYPLLILNKSIFAGGIRGSLFVRSTFWWPVQGPEKTTPKAWAGEWTGAVPTIEAVAAHCFSCPSWSLKVCLSPGSELTLSLHLKLSSFYLWSVLSFCLSGWDLVLYASTCLALRSDFFFFLIFIYLFLAVLGLHFCARAFSSCSKRGPLFITVRVPLTITASLVAEHKLQTCRLSSCGSQA